jgi:hypothetical protein
MRSDADKAVRKGLQHIYNFEFEKAHKEFETVTQAYPQHPVGYFLGAMVDWWHIYSSMNPTDEMEAAFEQKIDKTITLCDSLLEENEYSIVGLFFRGGAIGYRARYHVDRKEWFSAAQDGREALDMVMRAWDLAPGNKDILLGIGLYHYFADVIPAEYPLTKPFLMFLAEAGDRLGGLDELALAGEDARYAATEAQVVLMQIYYKFEKDYHSSMELAESLLQKYPKNAMIHRYLGRCYIRLGKRNKAEETWREILNRCIDKENGYDGFTAREAMYYIGLNLMRQQKIAKAELYFRKCAEFCEGLDSDPSGYMALTNLRLGYVYDLQGKRKEALQQYERVLDIDDFRNSHDLAERYLEQPFK